MRVKRVLITGAAGQLGQALQAQLNTSAAYLDVLALRREQLDVTEEADVRHVMSQVRPHVVIHTAAMTDVDEAERNRDKAFLVNAFGTRNIAVAVEQMGAKLVYISTDYVFDGCRRQAYTEFDQPSPVNVYGASKFAGEQYVQHLCRRYFIVRTAWLYGKGKTHFIARMLDRARSHARIRVVADQIGSPTYASDLASLIEQLIHTHAYGTYHAVNQGSCSRYELMRHVLRCANLTDQVDLIPATSHDFPVPAQRPAYSALDDFAIRLHGFARLRSWQEAVCAYIGQYYSEEGRR